LARITNSAPGATVVVVVVDVVEVVDVVVDVEVEVVAGVVVVVTADVAVDVLSAIEDAEETAVVEVESLLHEAMVRARRMMGARRIGFTVGSLARPVTIT
jgi:hypothetical protein